MKISKRSVDALQTPSDRCWVWDTEIKGFGIALRPIGTHSCVFNYRDVHSRQKNITIGKLGTMTPDEVRKRAEKLRRVVGDGRSPIAEERAARAAMNMSDLLDRYPGSERFKRKAASTQTVDRGRIERHLRPLLGNLVLEAVTPRDIEADTQKSCRRKSLAIQLRDPGTSV